MRGGSRLLAEFRRKEGSLELLRKLSGLARSELRNRTAASP
jgi:hypothetical protein